MILGPDGKLARAREDMAVARWFQREAIAALKRSIRQQVTILDASGRPWVDPSPRVGQTIRVRVPERYR